MSHGQPHSILRMAAIVFLALLLLAVVILSALYDTDKGETVEQWHQDHPNASERQLININTASLDELMELENMGKVTAQNILRFRERFVRFTSVDELAKVPGVSEADVALWKPCITV